MKKRGYEFILLEEALRDKAYQLPESYTGRNGTSWIQRWAMTQKHQPTIMQFKEEPNVPEFIQKAYESRSRCAAQCHESEGCYLCRGDKIRQCALEAVRK
jgi:hypothetical protein